MKKYIFKDVSKIPTWVYVYGIILALLFVNVGIRGYFAVVDVSLGFARVPWHLKPIMTIVFSMFSSMNMGFGIALLYSVYKKNAESMWVVYFAAFVVSIQNIFLFAITGVAGDKVSMLVTLGTILFLLPLMVCVRILRAVAENSKEKVVVEVIDSDDEIKLS